MHSPEVRTVELMIETPFGRRYVRKGLLVRRLLQRLHGIVGLGGDDIGDVHILRVDPEEHAVVRVVDDGSSRI